MTFLETKTRALNTGAEIKTIVAVGNPAHLAVEGRATETVIGRDIDRPGTAAVEAIVEAAVLAMVGPVLARRARKL